MTRLTVATLDLKEGHEIELLPDLVSQAGNIDLFFVQGGKAWHRDGQRTRYRAEWLLASIGLGHSLMTASARGPVHTLVFWRASAMHPVTHYEGVWPDALGEQSGLAGFAVEGFAPVVNTMSVQWATSRSLTGKYGQLSGRRRSVIA